MSNEISLSNSIFRRGAFSQKGIEKTLGRLDANGDNTVSENEIASANFSSDTKTQIFKTALTAGLQITETNIEALESKMEDTYKEQKNRANNKNTSSL